jgi:hypothetical protein
MTANESQSLHSENPPMYMIDPTVHYRAHDGDEQYRVRVTRVTAAASEDAETSARVNDTAGKCDERNGQRSSARVTRSLAAASVNAETSARVNESDSESDMIDDSSQRAQYNRTKTGIIAAQQHHSVVGAHRDFAMLSGVACLDEQNLRQ